MYHSEFEANIKGFKAVGSISRKANVKVQKGFGLFHLMCYAGTISVMATLLSAIF